MYMYICMYVYKYIYTYIYIYIYIKSKDIHLWLAVARDALARNRLNRRLELAVRLRAEDDPLEDRRKVLEEGVLRLDR